MENPHGILFHPFAIERMVQRIVQRDYYRLDEVIQSGERYYSFEHHSIINADSAGELIKWINNNLDVARRLLKTTTHLFLTFGTAFVYKHLERGIYVANCHKIPQNAFVKELIGVQALMNSIMNTLELLYEYNSGLKIILTISPVRHLRDGMTAGLRSKSHLISAVHACTEQTPARYFPSYELLMDDLRDYRFYAPDMIHPSSAAVDYIFDFLSQVYIHPKVHDIMKEVERIRKDMQHKPFHPDSDSHRKFLVKLEKKKKSLFERTGISLDEGTNPFYYNTL
jgi:hypothetical protein